MRKTEFVGNEFYHIYNRGVDKREIFSDEADYTRFWLYLNLLNDRRDGLMDKWKNYKRDAKHPTLIEFQQRELSSRQTLVEIVSYCMNPNHYHFILKQCAKKGIEKFMHKIGTGYTNYFNQKKKRTGSLFQGRFKSSQIKPNALLYLSVYVNCNSEIHGVASARNYRWCSFPDYIGERKENLCNKEDILRQFRNHREYFEFAVENIKDQKQRKADEKILLESDGS
jgi:REP element-mobilizing transposase RayT